MPLVSYVAPWSVTDADSRRRQTTDDDRRTASKTILAPSLCVGGPVISDNISETVQDSDKYNVRLIGNHTWPTDWYQDL